MHGVRACVRTCPSGIDIRDGIQIACINCAECVDSCSLQRQRYGKDPWSGTPGKPQRMLNGRE